jgi:hypothetical protein
VGENSPFHSAALHMCAKMNKKFSVLVEVQTCGSLAIEEQIHAMIRITRPMFGEKKS